MRTLQVARSLSKARALKTSVLKALALFLLFLPTYEHASGASVSKMLLICASNLEKCMLSELGGGVWQQLELGCEKWLIYIALWT